nr:reverse transcriptase domain-containing protein [Tanacetum cinerariifolium]
MNAGEFPEMDPYEEVAQQGQVHPLSHAYVSNPMELDKHVPVHVLELEHLEYDASSDDDIQVEDDDKDPKEPSEGSDETKPLEEDETAVTPPPPRQRRARISVRPQTPMAASTKALIDAFAAGSSPFPLPPTSPAYDQRRFAFTAPPPGCDVAESSAAATRAPRSQYDFVDTGSERRMMTSIEEVNLRVSYQAQIYRQESKCFYTQLHDAQTDGRDIRLEIDVVRGQRTAYETELQERQSAEDLAVTQMMRIHTLEARAHTDMVEDVDSSWTEGVVGLSQRLENMESVFHISGCSINNQVKFATCTLLGAALTWWNGHVRTLGHEAAYAMTWGTLKKKMTDKYCPKGEIKKLKIELWNLRVKGNDVAAYTQRFQELALMCTKFLANETEKVDKYISGLPDNIHGNVISARPKTLDETIESANDLMD